MLHSFHLALLPPSMTLRALRRAPRADGLRHAECLALMRLGSPAVSVERMQLRRLAMFAEWEDESALERFLADEDLGRRAQRRLARAVAVPAALRRGRRPGRPARFTPAYGIRRSRSWP